MDIRLVSLVINTYAYMEAEITKRTMIKQGMWLLMTSHCLT